MSATFFLAAYRRYTEATSQLNHARHARLCRPHHRRQRLAAVTGVVAFTLITPARMLNEYYEEHHQRAFSECVTPYAYAPARDRHRYTFRFQTMFHATLPRYDNVTGTIAPEPVFDLPHAASAYVSRLSHIDDIAAFFTLPICFVH